MSIDPERIYNELGKTVAEEVHHTEAARLITERQRDEQMEMTARHKAEREKNEQKLSAAKARRLDLLETVRLINEEGMDPTLAKLKARESREDRAAKYAEDRPTISNSRITVTQGGRTRGLGEL